MALGQLGIGVKRPDLHAARPLIEQAPRELVRVVEKRVEIFVAPMGAILVQTPVRDRLCLAATDVSRSGAGVVSADPVARAASQQVIEGQSGRLAAKVPEGDVDGRGGARLGAA